MTITRKNEREALIAACDRLLETEREVLGMDDAESREWFLNKPGHRDCREGAERFTDNGMGLSDDPYPKEVRPMAQGAGAGAPVRQGLLL
jgi:hypothetical protein